eukprot:6870124-Alexandrium_andersonii.AAC.1
MVEAPRAHRRPLGRLWWAASRPPPAPPSPWGLDNPGQASCWSERQMSKSIVPQPHCDTWWAGKTFACDELTDRVFTDERGEGEHEESGCSME